MPGLIPLMLNPAAAGTRGSVIAPSPQTASSENGSPEQLTSPPPPGTQYAPASFQRLTKRSATAPSNLPILPYTPAEWVRAVGEVKRLYLHRRYGPCSARCSSILDNIKDTSTVEPAYLIYLHFYAALSLEMSARALSSPHRTNLLHQAETHYTRAATLIQSEDTAIKRLSHASTASTCSLVSPVSSRASTASTRLSSPPPSLYEERLPSAMRSSTSSAPKKRVTFSDEQPLIRPDSPTLGFDDWAPEPKVAPELQPAARPVEVVPERCTGMFFDQKTDRYASVLSDLLTQVDVHLAGVRTELARDDAPSGCSTPESAASQSSAPEGGREDLRKRIDRLRLNGWRRKRFDPARYQALRESVLAELE